MNLGERLRLMRESKNVSIYKLSQESGVSENHIRSLERGIKSAKVETLEMLIKALNITMSEFFNEDDSVSYPTPNEKILLEYYRTLPNNTANAVTEFCKKLLNQ